jgi:hypothetical protein
MAVSGSRVVVSIATIPNRIGLMKPTIESLLNGDLVPDVLVIGHPEYCNWAKSGYDIPDFLTDENFCRGIVKHVIVDFDWGPGTKLLAAVDMIRDDDILVLADDDVVYDREFLKNLVAAQRADHQASFSYFTYRCGGITFGQGCDGYSFYGANLHGVKAFVEKHVKGTPLLYHDDLWIGFFVYMNHLSVHRVLPPRGNRLVYQQVLPNDALSGPPTVNLARQNITRESLPRLFRDCGISAPRRFKAQSLSAYDWVRMKARNVKRRLAG